MSAYSADWFTGRPIGKKGLRAFYLGRALRAYVYRGERHGVMYTGDGKRVCIQGRALRAYVYRRR